jgi:hypothetical protein
MPDRSVAMPKNGPMWTAPQFALFAYSANTSGC